MYNKITILPRCCVSRFQYPVPHVWYPIRPYYVLRAVRNDQGSRPNPCTWLLYSSIFLLYKSDPQHRPLDFHKTDRVLDGGDAAAGQLHRRVVELNLGAAVEVVDARAVGRQLADGGNLDGSLVLVPLLSLGLGRGVVLGRALGLLRHLLVVDHGLLLDGGGIVHGVGFLGGVGVDAVAHAGALASDGREAGAVRDGGAHALGVVLGLVTGNLEGRVDVGVHGSDARVALLDDVERLLHRLSALKHNGVLLDGVVADILHVVLMHLLAKVGEGGSAVHDVSLGHGLAGNDGRDGPSHGLSRGRRGLAHVRLGSAVVHDLVGVEATLVRAALVLDHGGLAAEALEATVVGAFVGALAGVDAAMAGEGRGLVIMLAGFASRVQARGCHTSEKRLPQPRC